MRRAIGSRPHSREAFFADELKRSGIFRCFLQAAHSRREQPTLIHARLLMRIVC